MIRNLLKLSAKSVLIPLVLAAAATTNAAVHKKIFGSGTMNLIISNEETNDIVKIIKSLQESMIKIKGVSKTIKIKEEKWKKNEEKKQKGGFLRMLLDALISLLGNLLTGKGTVRFGAGTISTGEGTVIAGQDF